MSLACWWPVSGLQPLNFIARGVLGILTFPLWQSEEAVYAEFSIENYMRLRHCLSSLKEVLCVLSVR